MIGIFDSGLGGLTVARAIMRELPREKILYLGDTARGPYGNKTPEEVSMYAIQNTKWLLKKRAKAIVVGCNTASAVAGIALRREFPDVPVLEVISPAVREALRVSRTGKIGVIGTRTTVNSGAYQKWCRGIQARECPMFVPLVESGHLAHPTTYEIAERYLKSLKESRIDTLILGCTHYPFLKSVIADIMGDRVRLVDSAETVAKEVARLITPPTRPHPASGHPLPKGEGRVRGQKRDRGVMNSPKHEFYVSKKTPRFQELAEKWLGHAITLKLAKI